MRGVGFPVVANDFAGMRVFCHTQSFDPELANTSIQFSSLRNFTDFLQARYPQKCGYAPSTIILPIVGFMPGAAIRQNVDIQRCKSIFEDTNHHSAFIGYADSFCCRPPCLVRSQEQPSGANFKTSDPTQIVPVSAEGDLEAGEHYRTEANSLPNRCTTSFEASTCPLPSLWLIGFCYIIPSVSMIGESDNRHVNLPSNASLQNP